MGGRASASETLETGVFGNVWGIWVTGVCGDLGVHGVFVYDYCYSLFGFMIRIRTSERANERRMRVCLRYQRLSVA